jgi:hypothetical protein
LAENRDTAEGNGPVARFQRRRTPSRVAKRRWNLKGSTEDRRTHIHSSAGFVAVILTPRFLNN